MAFRVDGDEWLLDVGDAGVVRRSRTGGGPEKLAVGFKDGDVVDAGFTPQHQAAFVVLPQFVAVAAIPLAAGVVAFVLVAHGDPVVSEGPQGFDQAVIEFSIPFTSEKRPYLVTADDKFAPVAPHRIFGVSEGNAVRIAGVPV